MYCRRQSRQHVFSEKPLARNAEEAKSALDAANKAVSSIWSLSIIVRSGSRQAYELIQSGALGALPLPRGVFAGMDYASLQHPIDLAPGQESSRKWSIR